MRFVRESSAAAGQVIAGRISDALWEGQRVLWLVCGGSSIDTEAEIMTAVREKASQRLDGLAILPTDERYGPPGHKDSNYKQLRDAGFDPGKATWVDVLMHDVPLDQTVSFYSDVAATAFANAGLIIAVFGIGSDGHIAGILPGSPAATADEVNVVGYDADPFIRLTLTPAALKQVNVAYALVYGEAKKPALERLQANKETLIDLPSSLLYSLPEAYVYNDQIEKE